MTKILSAVFLLFLIAVSCNKDETITELPYIDVQNDSVYVAFNDTSAHVVTIKSNVKWTIGGYDTSWCTIQTKEEATSSTDSILMTGLVITLAKNMQQTDRISTITIKTVSLGNKTIVVKQSGMPASKKLLVHKMTFTLNTDTDTITYTYDNLNRIVEVNYTTYSNGYGGSEVKKLTYDADRISKMEIKNSYNKTTQIITYTYTENKIAAIQDNKEIDFWIFDKDGRVKNDREGHSFFYDKLGNVVDEELQGIYTSYKFDNKKGIYSGTATPHWWLKTETRDNNSFNMLNHGADYTVNNAIEKSEGVAITYFTYQYNTEGYPILIHNSLYTEDEVKITYMPAK